MDKRKITLAHGSGGRLMHTLIDEVFRKRFANPALDEKGDSAIIEVSSEGMELAFTTDSYVVNPVFFPGGDIGKLAVCGTVNDLAVEGAVPRYISCGFVIEDGFDVDALERIVDSMAKVCGEQGVAVVTGDLKVVERGACDKIFINTSGIGLKSKKVKLSGSRIKPGDKLLINGGIGEHGVAVLIERGDFHFDADIMSDCAPLAGLIKEILKTDSHVKFMRDPTRGGLAATLNEIVEGMGFGIVAREEDIPVKEEVKAACEMLGLDPLYVANEGKVVIVAADTHAEEILGIMRAHPLGRDSRIIGEVIENPAGKVLMKTRIGGTRIVGMMAGDQLPRIC